MRKVNFQLINHINVSIKSLSEYPFYLNNDLIDKSINCMYKIYYDFLYNADILAEKKKITMEKAKELLITKGEKYPKYDKLLDIPKLVDIAFRLKPIIAFVEDEVSAVNNIVSFYKERGVNSEIIDYEDIKQKAIFFDCLKRKKKFYLWFVLDWLIPKDKDGIKLYNRIKKNIETISPRPTIEIYTQYTRERVAERVDEKTKIILKHWDDSKIEKIVESNSKNLFQIINKNFKIFPNNPYLEIFEIAA
ncbi:MAG: hypothetical protein NT166_23340 [Candidatus Aminicenantes bacterium]|nr:hypothetical protein [Candidatus Aminicenantes bacterium]